MHGKQQVKRLSTGDVSWHYPVDARELVESKEYAIVSDIDAGEPVEKEIRTTTGAPIRDNDDPVTRDDREKQLTKLTAGEVRAIGEQHGLEAGKKADMIAAILEKEFGE